MLFLNVYVSFIFNVYKDTHRFYQPTKLYMGKSVITYESDIKGKSVPSKVLVCKFKILFRWLNWIFVYLYGKLSDKNTNFTFPLIAKCFPIKLRKIKFSQLFVLVKYIGLLPPESAHMPAPDRLLTLFEKYNCPYFERNFVMLYIKMFWFRCLWSKV